MSAALKPSALTGIFATLHSMLATPVVVLPLIPSPFQNIWESILRAVPKKKPTYSKRRMRQLAGKALPNLTNLNNCPACGRVKRAHTLCEHCVSSIQRLWRNERKEGPEITGS